MHSRLITLVAGAAAACVALTAPVGAAGAPGKRGGVAAERSVAALQRPATVAHKLAPRGKLAGGLAALAASKSATVAGRQKVAPAASAALTRLQQLMRVSGGYVTVDAYARGDAAALKTQLVSKGMLDPQVYGQVVSGRVPLAALDDIAATANLARVLPVLARTSAGNVTSQGDIAQRSDEARQKAKVKGKGVRVGVLSDSYNCATGPFAPGAPFSTAEDDRRSDDVPKDVIVLDDVSGCDGGSDEGRAMMQIVHDVAPGAAGAFASAFSGQAGFANAIVALQEQAGSNVIVDDVIYFAEPMFADGVIAQAANTVARRGVPYFSSAGNQARQSYESAYRESGDLGPSGPRHDFDPGPGVDTLQSWIVPSSTNADGSTTYTFDLLAFQWDAPYLSAGAPGGSDSDVDLYFYDAAGNLLPDCSDPTADPCQFPGFDFNIGGDPVEFGLVYNGTGAPIEVQVSVERFEGPAPTRVKWVQFALGIEEGAPLEYDTRSSTIFGHANAAGAEAVGAASWYNTTEWGNLLFGADCGYACLTGYSSAGGTPIMFGENGRRLRRPEYRVKPGVTGPDGGNTTFFFFDLGFAVDGEPDGWPNFFGTSASAPHVAGIAALMLEASDGKLGPKFVYDLLRLTATDMTVRRIPGVGFEPLKRGFDFDSGFGFVDATKAVCTARWLDRRSWDNWREAKDCK